MSNLVSYTLLRFEINVRGATVIGFVGAGGIGQDMITAIRKFYYSDVSAMLLMIIVCGDHRHAIRPPAAPAAGNGDGLVSEMHGVREVLIAHTTELCARYPEFLIAGWRRRTPLLACCVGAIGLYVAGLVALGISPAVIISGLGRLIDIAGLMLPPDPQKLVSISAVSGGAGQTLAIAFLGSLLAAILGIPFGFLAARNVVANRLIHFLSRRSLDTLRSVDTLIWALIWINVVGLGPFAGALAIMSSDIGFPASKLPLTINICGWKRASTPQPSSSGLPKPPADALYSSFSARFAERVAQSHRRIDELRSDRRRVVVWGAGAKGVTFLNLLRLTAGSGVDWVVDINPRKQGHFVPLMGQRIVGPDFLLENPPQLVIVLNPEYELEVRSMINDRGIDCEVVSA